MQRKARESTLAHLNSSARSRQLVQCRISGLGSSMWAVLSHRYMLIVHDIISLLSLIFIRELIPQFILFGFRAKCPKGRCERQRGSNKLLHTLIHCTKTEFIEVFDIK